MALEITDTGAHVQLSLVDKVRVPELSELRTAAMTVVAANKDVELDLRRSEHLHVGALQILMSLENAIVSAGHRFRVAGTSPEAAAALSLSGLSTWMEHA